MNLELRGLGYQDEEGFQSSRVGRIILWGSVGGCRLRRPYQPLRIMQEHAGVELFLGRGEGGTTFLESPQD